MAFSYKEGFIRNREAFMIGMPRLRQKRIKEGERIEEKKHERFYTNVSKITFF